MSIHILPPEIASQIAAGEVVERPASVVKEALENAIDAGATSIEIEIVDAGRKLIRISDDGHGIPFAELPLAVERHATSKLTNSADLFNITTLGFRGEALASIGSVSRLTVTSRIGSETAGGRMVVDGGILRVQEPAGVPQGTTIVVEDLFYNVPARLKFLKHDLTERRVIDSLVAKYALAYPRIRFRQVDNHSITLQTSGDGDRRAIYAALYGIEIARQMLEVHAAEEPLQLGGFISPASITRSNRKEITFFINGRWVSDTPLTQALLQAYNTLLMVGRYPMAALFLNLSPEDVDVNVHPTKAEVRFKNQDQVFSFVQRSVKRAYLAYAPVTSLPNNQMLWSNTLRKVDDIGPGSALMDREMASDNQRIEWLFGHEDNTETLRSETSETISDSVGNRSPEFDLDEFRSPMLRLVGQVGGTYLIAEGPDGLYLIDQHAAHERILFEKLMAQHQQQKITKQALLAPVLVKLSAAQAKLVEPQLPFLHHLGMEIEEFGSDTFQIRSMPAIFTNLDANALISALVDDFSEDETPLASEIEAKIAGRVCKTLAIKAGQSLSPMEQANLLTELEKCANPRSCPHGRPTMIHLSVELLERQFGRRGAR